MNLLKTILSPEESRILWDDNLVNKNMIDCGLDEFYPDTLIVKDSIHNISTNYQLFINIIIITNIPIYYGWVRSFLSRDLFIGTYR